MRTKFKFLIPLAALSLALTSCGGSSLQENARVGSSIITEEWSEYSLPISEFLLDKKNVTLYVPDESNDETHPSSYQYTYSVHPKDADLSSLVWEVENPNIASITDDGLLTAVSAGKTNVIVSDAKGGFDAIKSSVEVIKRIKSFTISAPTTDLDLNSSYEFDVAFEPIDTTQNILKYEISEGGDSLISISSNTVTTKGEEGTVTVTVSSDYLPNQEPVEFTFDIKDRTVHVESVTLSCETDKVEVGKSVQLDCEVLPANAKAISTEGISYTALTPEIATIDENGLVTGIKEGEAKFKAHCEEDSEEFTLDVYQVYATAIHIEDVIGDEINLSNASDAKAEYQLVISYDDENGGHNPSKMNAMYSTLNDKVATVDPLTGLITAKGPGSTTIKVSTLGRDDVEISASVTVNVEFYCTSISISGAKEMYLDDDPVVLTANLIPENISDKTVTWTANPASKVLLQEDGNKVTVTPLDFGPVIITASCGLATNTHTLTIKERPVLFEYAHVYLRGNKNFSKPLEVSAATSEYDAWTQAKYAYKFGDMSDTGEGYIQSSVTMYLTAGDEFKFYVHNTVDSAVSDDSSWIQRYEESDPDREHVQNAGAFANGLLAFTSTARDANVKVMSTGYYNIYAKQYDDGFYQFYLEDGSLNVSKTYLEVLAGEEETFEIHNWLADHLVVESNNPLIASVTVSENGIATVTGHAEGSVIITVTDTVKSFEIKVNVYEGSFPVDVPDHNGYYLVGSKTDYKYKGATEIPELLHPDFYGNVAVLRNYPATSGEIIKARYYNEGEGKDAWGFGHPAEGLGSVDNEGNFVLLVTANIDIYVKWEGEQLEFYVAEHTEPDVPEHNGYYLVGSKNNFKYANSTEVPSLDKPDKDGNVAILKGYEASKDEAIKVRYYNLEEGKDDWSSTIAVEGLGELDDMGNFVLLKDASLDIYVKWEGDTLMFYVAEHSGPSPEEDLPEATGYYLVGSKTNYKFLGAPIIPELSEADKDGNIAILYKHSVEKDETIKVHYYNLEKSEDKWGSTVAVEGLGELDESGNFKLLKDAEINVFVKYEGDVLKFYIAEYQEPGPEPEQDLPEVTGYYLVGSKTDYKFAGATMVPELSEADKDGNIAILYNHAVEKDETIKVHYYNLEKSEDKWGSTVAVEGLGELDDDGNFKLLKDANINVFVKYEGDVLKFYVAEYQAPDVPAVTGYYLVGSKTNFKYAGSTMVPELSVADKDGNIAILKGYTATAGEKIKIRYHNLEKNEDVWSQAGNDTIAGLGSRDSDGNFVLTVDATIDIYVKWVGNNLLFYVALHA